VVRLVGAVRRVLALLVPRPVRAVVMGRPGTALASLMAGRTVRTDRPVRVRGHTRSGRTTRLGRNSWAAGLRRPGRATNRSWFLLGAGLISGIRPAARAGVATGTRTRTRPAPGARPTIRSRPRLGARLLIRCHGRSARAGQSRSALAGRRALGVPGIVWFGPLLVSLTLITRRHRRRRNRRRRPDRLDRPRRSRRQERHVQGACRALVQFVRAGGDRRQGRQRRQPHEHRDDQDITTRRAGEAVRAIDAAETLAQGLDRRYETVVVPLRHFPPPVVINLDLDRLMG
jgi:hypothetical protein